MCDESARLAYLNSNLIDDILKQLENETLVDFDVKHSGGLDGFMSALYNISLRSFDNKTKVTKERQLIAKFMKGDIAFRESSKSFIQFKNEVFIYANVLPYYSEVIRKSGTSSISVLNWVPKVYVAKFGYIEGLSDPSNKSCESVVVLENLKPKGYTLGPRLYLDRNHLLTMIQPIAEYHAMSYVLRIQEDPHLNNLIEGIEPLPFRDDSNPNDDKTNLYKVLYRVAFDRFFEYYDRLRIEKNANVADEKLENNLQKLREKYYKNPTALLEFIRVNFNLNTNDRNFAAILHGDFNRNNVLFRYNTNSTDEKVSANVPTDAIMIDFQELRYSTPAIDLSFFMYMNTDPSIREGVWMEVLKKYHATMFETISTVLNLKEKDALNQFSLKLQDYSFDKFHEHFSKYAFYGVLICMHFLPWMCCSEEECAKLSDLFETDMHGEEFRKISIEAGGDEVNLNILEVVKHANRMGYMDSL